MQLPPFTDRSVPAFSKSLQNAFSKMEGKVITDDIRNKFVDLYGKSKIHAFCPPIILGPLNQTRPLKNYTEVDVCSESDNNNQTMSSLETLVTYVLNLIKNFFMFIFNRIFN